MNSTHHYLTHLTSGHSLSTEQSRDLFSRFMQLPLSQQSAILSAISTRGPCTEEIIGALQFLRDQAVFFPPQENIVDIVGTGGDGLKTFNISTAASLVLASCGVKVAKHGGRAVSSLTGSKDVIQALGIPAHQTVKDILYSLTQHHYAFISAPTFNPALRDLAPLRKELGIPTLLNIVGPIANPLRPLRQVIGVYQKQLLHKIAETCQTLGAKHVMVVHSQEGLDEISISGRTSIVELKNGYLQEYSLCPQDAGLKSAPLEMIEGGSPQENAALIHGILKGEIQDARRDVVLLNAAAGLMVADRTDSIREGVNMARTAIESGQSYTLLQHLQRRAS
jgi:anthranilate phosphoribosyltransferase